jgi:hypothetical protein
MTSINLPKTPWTVKVSRLNRFFIGRVLLVIVPSPAEWVGFTPPQAVGLSASGGPQAD